MTLDEAWAEAEAALPAGGRLHLQQRANAETIVTDRGQTWVARQGRAAGAYEAWATTSSVSLGFAYADTPVVMVVHRRNEGRTARAWRAACECWNHQDGCHRKRQKGRRICGWCRYAC